MGRRKGGGRDRGWMEAMEFAACIHVCTHRGAAILLSIEYLPHGHCGSHFQTFNHTK